MSLIIKKPEPKPKQSPYKYAWTRVDNGPMNLVFDDSEMSIWEENGEWIAAATLGGKKYRTSRDTLEGAAKAADRLLYKNFPHVWTQTDARAIINPWKGDLCQLG
jgi:hypothetical protein